jgi:hypothetical protein
VQKAAVFQAYQLQQSFCSQAAVVLQACKRQRVQGAGALQACSGFCCNPAA